MEISLLWSVSFSCKSIRNPQCLNSIRVRLFNKEKGIKTDILYKKQDISIILKIKVNSACEEGG